MTRLEYLREQLAALDSYGNGDGQRAAAVRAEIGLIEAQDAADEAARDLTDARHEAELAIGVALTPPPDDPPGFVVPTARPKRGK